MATTTQLGIGWRPELARFIERRTDLTFVEVLAEDFDPVGPFPPTLQRLRRRGVTLLPHGVSLSLGSAEPPEAERIDHLARTARWCDAPLVSEHIAFVHAGGLESGHLLPLPQTEAALEVLLDNVKMVQARLGVPLALENIATLCIWPHAEMDEPAFLTEIIRRSGVGLLLDVENVYANCRNHGGDPVSFLERLPLDRLAYVHVAGGRERDGVYHDTHTTPVPEAVLELLEELCARAAVPAVVLERDDHFPEEDDLHRELDAIAAAIRRGASRRERSHVAC